MNLLIDPWIPVRRRNGAGNCPPVGLEELLCGEELWEIEAHLRKPVYTPSLGRRSCPLARPLLDVGNCMVSAENGIAALGQIPPMGGLIYAETDAGQVRALAVRDIPMHRGKRLFATRKVYVHTQRETADVHQPD